MYLLSGQYSVIAVLVERSARAEIIWPGPARSRTGSVRPVFNLDVTYHMIRNRVKSPHQSQCLLAYIVIKLKKLILKFI